MNVVVCVKQVPDPNSPGPPHPSPRPPFRSPPAGARMTVAVCVKQVPDPNSSGQLDPSTHNLKRDGELVLDPGDEFGVEAGLQLAEKHGGEVTVVSMGPERGVDAVRKALAMGAAKGVLISDASLAGSDALTTAKVLAAAIRTLEFD